MKITLLLWPMIRQIEGYHGGRSSAPIFITAPLLAARKNNCASVAVEQHKAAGKNPLARLRLGKTASTVSVAVIWQWPGGF
jgi:hypothetical protein